MTDLDADLVRRWLTGLGQSGSTPGPQVSAWLEDAVAGRAPARLPDPDAGLLTRYLHGIAIGIAGTATGTPAPAGMCLTAGLLAGAAALESVDRIVAAAARMAGLAAADRAVEDEDVSAVVLAAVRATAQEPVRTVVAALAQASRRPAAPVEPASCGAGPEDPAGVPFAAEVSFTSSADPQALRRSLTGLAQEMWFWPGVGETRVHLHTDQAGPCIAEAYAAGLVFALRVTAR